MSTIAAPLPPRDNHGAFAGTTAEILHARAKALARPDTPTDAVPSLEVVEFLIGAERYAVESAMLREAYPLRDLTPVPCTPAFILGIVTVRGHILTVVDLRDFFDLPKIGLTDMNKVLILEGTDAGGHSITLGVMADAVQGVRSIPLDQIQPPLPTFLGVRADYLRGVTSDDIAILDARRLLADERLIVNEGVDD